MCDHLIIWTNLAHFILGCKSLAWFGGPFFYMVRIGSAFRHGSSARRSWSMGIIDQSTLPSSRLERKNKIQKTNPRISKLDKPARLSFSCSLGWFRFDSQLPSLISLYVFVWEDIIQKQIAFSDMSKAHQLRCAKKKTFVLIFSQA